MNKSFFIQNKNGFLTGLVIALFVVAALLLGRAGLLGDSMTKLTGDLLDFRYRRAASAVERITDPEIRRPMPVPEGGRFAPDPIDPRMNDPEIRK